MIEFHENPIIFQLLKKCKKYVLIKYFDEFLEQLK